MSVALSMETDTATCTFCTYAVCKYQDPRNVYWYQDFEEKPMRRGSFVNRSGNEKPDDHGKGRI